MRAGPLFAELLREVRPLDVPVPGERQRQREGLLQLAEVGRAGGERILATLSRQLNGAHFRELLPLDQPLQRDFYAEMCRVQRWSVRQLR